METRGYDVKRFLSRATGALALVAGAVGCGNLDNVTTVKDLRVLAVQAEPAGFLVPIDDAKSLTTTQSTLTALVADPKGGAATLSVQTVACPDYVDTITSASGKGSKLCPDASVTSQLPAPLNTLLATTNLPDSTAMTIMGSTIEYAPTATFGISPDDLQEFFAATSPVFAQSVQYNRDFGMDAIVGFTFALGAERATAIKRIVYWPLLPADEIATIHPKMPGDPPGLDCPDAQVPNQNPRFTSLDLYQHRVDGAPTDLYTDATPTISISAKDQLYVQPVWDPASIEKYYLRVKNTDLGEVVTECHHELLTFQFYATAGSFSPGDRQSELPPVFDKDSVLRTDSQYNPPSAADLPPDGKVTIWVVARDERAGEGWSRRTITVTP